MRTEVQEEEIKTGLRGDEQKQLEAVCKLYDRYADPLASFLRENFPTLDCDELTTSVNDVFIGLAKKAKQGNFQLGGSLVGLLFRMARFRAIDQLDLKYKQQQRRVELQDFANGEQVGQASDELSDDEVVSIVASKLSYAPQIAAAWRIVSHEWTPAQKTAATEIVRLFKMWLATLPPTQRKVAEIIATRFGQVTDEEICDELNKTGKSVPLGSVKSARREIREKFKSLIETKERNKTP